MVDLGWAYIKDDGCYTVWLVEMPNVISQGKTLEEAKANLQDALHTALDYLRAQAKQEEGVQTTQFIPLAVSA